MLTNDVFVYHLDNEIQKLFSLNRYNNESLYSLFKLVTKIAFLICDRKILVPASNYFESDISFKILNELNELNEIGAIDLISSSYNINELLNKKAGQHGSNISLPNYHYNEFLKEDSIILPGTLKKRKKSASTDIKSSWYPFINDISVKDNLFNMSNNNVKASKFEDILYEVPRKLGNKAYISEYILPLLPIEKHHKKKADAFLNAFVTREYIASFLNEYNATCLTNIPIIDSNVILPSNLKDEYCYISYSKIIERLKLSKYKNINSLDFIKTCTTYELIEFKNSIEWNLIIENLICNKSDYNNSIQGEISMNSYNDIKIGVITALPKECAAMKAMMQEVKELHFDAKGAGHRFFIGKIPSANGKYHKVALMLCGMGNNNAAIRATNMLNHFKSVESIIMTGIAGGIPSYQHDNKQVRLGDIVVSQKVTQYDFTKELPDGSECRSNQSKPSAQLLEAIDIMKTYEYENRYPWQEYIDEFASTPPFSKPSMDTDLLYDFDGNLCEHIKDSTRTKYPKVFMGGIASANNLLKNPQKRDELKKDYDVLAVEMEASGISDATWNQSVEYLVVRGICDYCDTHKNDLWQEYAALVAAAYTRAIIETLPCFC